MVTLLLHLLRLLPLFCGGHRQLAIENLALRQQLAVYDRLLHRAHRSAPRPLRPRRARPPSPARRPVLRQNHVGAQAVDLSVLIQTQSRLDAHFPAPPSTLPPSSSAATASSRSRTLSCGSSS